MTIVESAILREVSAKKAEQIKKAKQMRFWIQMFVSGAKQNKGQGYIPQNKSVISKLVHSSPMSGNLRETSVWLALRAHKKALEKAKQAAKFGKFGEWRKYKQQAGKFGLQAERRRTAFERERIRRGREEEEPIYQNTAAATPSSDFDLGSSSPTFRRRGEEMESIVGGRRLREVNPVLRAAIKERLFRNNEKKHSRKGRNEIMPESIPEMGYRSYYGNLRGTDEIGVNPDEYLKTMRAKVNANKRLEQLRAESHARDIQRFKSNPPIAPRNIPLRNMVTKPLNSMETLKDLFSSGVSTIRDKLSIVPPEADRAMPKINPQVAELQKKAREMVIHGPKALRSREADVTPFQTSSFTHQTFGKMRRRAPGFAAVRNVESPVTTFAQRSRQLLNKLKTSRSLRYLYV